MGGWRREWMDGGVMDGWKAEPMDGWIILCYISAFDTWSCSLVLICRCDQRCETTWVSGDCNPGPACYHIDVHFDMFTAYSLHMRRILDVFLRCGRSGNDLKFACWRWEASGSLLLHPITFTHTEYIYTFAMVIIIIVLSLSNMYCALLRELCYAAVLMLVSG